MLRTKLPAVWFAALVGLSLVAGASVAAQSTDAGTEVQVTSSPTDWDEAEATHTVVFTVGTDAESAGGQFDSLVVDYEPGADPADVGNVGPETVRWVGVDRDGDDVGTRVDETATVVDVDDAKDGQALRIETNGDLQLSAGDEVVAVYSGVQNPQDQGTTRESAVDVVLNGGDADDVASDAVSYGYNDASVTFADQETSDETVTVDSATLSEPGFVVVLNESGRNPDAVRGATSLGTGSHEDVRVELDPAVTADEELHAQVHLDTDGDRQFGYSGDRVDRPFEDRDGNLMASDPAEVTAVESGGPGNATGTATATSTGTATDSTNDDGAGTSTDEPGGTATDDATGDDADDETNDAGGFETVDAAADDTTDGDGAGFGVAAAVVVLLGSALVARRLP